MAEEEEEEEEEEEDLPTSRTVERDFEIGAHFAITKGTSVGDARPPGRTAGLANGFAKVSRSSQRHGGPLPAADPQWLRTGHGTGPRRHAAPHQPVLDALPAHGALDVPGVRGVLRRHHAGGLLRQRRRGVHLRRHQGAAHARQPAGAQPRLLRLLHDGLAGARHDRQLLLRDLGDGAAAVRPVRAQRLHVRLRVHLVDVHDRLRPLQRHREGRGGPADDREAGRAQDRRHLAVRHLLDAGAALRLESVRPRGQHDRVQHRLHDERLERALLHLLLLVAGVLHAALAHLLLLLAHPGGGGGPRARHARAGQEDERQVAALRRGLPQECGVQAGQGGAGHHRAVVPGLDALPRHRRVRHLRARRPHAAEQHLGRHVRQDECGLQSRRLCHQSPQIPLGVEAKVSALSAGLRRGVEARWRRQRRTSDDGGRVRGLKA